MAFSNQGDQKIGWKWSTPLNSDYLRTFLSNITTHGLLTRPKFDISITQSGATVVVGPFTALLIPPDGKTGIDENGNTFYQEAVKITFGGTKTIGVAKTDVAIALHYSIAEPGKVAAPNWYADINVLDTNAINDSTKYNPNSDIIIGTIQFYETESSGSSITKCSITTNGADISDALLYEEGWDPRCWLSVVHPIRANNVGGKIVYNCLEVRTHNKRYGGYMTGNSGVVYLGGPEHPLRYNLDPTIGPDNENAERGCMPFNYNCFSLQSRGFELSDGGILISDLINVHGGIFAIVDATGQNFNPTASSSNPAHATDDTAFTNKLIISPVRQEDINIYYNDDTQTLVIN